MFIHTAGLAHREKESFEIQERMHKINVLGTKQVLKFCDTVKIPKFVYISSTSVYDFRSKSEDLEINPSFIENPRIFLKQIADLLELNLNKIESDFYIRAMGKSPNEPYILIKDLNEKQIAKLSVNLKKIAIYLTTTQFKVFADGNQIYSTYNGTYVLNFNNISFRQNNGSVETKIQNKEIKLYNTALTDQELQALTRV